MESKFPQRVALERRCLDLVNEKTSGSPLVGLSRPTIRRWLDLHISASSYADWSSIESALLSAAEASRSEADISDEVFIDISEEDADNAMIRLERALLSIK